ncbi:MAG TPA: ABC transporter ATP-binding protein/permease [Candidatus Eubacterium faecavium]|nr:ABC transporter ATP-binding protein/permease [Candidatus Eubacterium faecavium]
MNRSFRRRQPQMTKSILKKVFKYIGRYKIVVVLSMICAAASALLTLYVPILVGQAIDYIIGPENVDFNAITAVALKIAVIVAVTAVLQWLMNVLNNRITFNVVRDMRNLAFKKLQVLPFNYLDSHQNGETVSRVISDADQFADGLLMGFTQLFTGVVTIIGTLAFMIYINFWIALLVVVLTPMSFLFANFIAKRTYKMFRKQSEARGEQTAFVDEMINNQRVTEAYGHKKENEENFEKINKRLSLYYFKATFYSSFANPGTRFVNNIVYAAVTLFGAILSVRGYISVGILSSFLAYAIQYTKPFNEISGVVTELQNAIACAGRLINLIEEKEIEPDTPEKKTLENVRGKIEIKNVDFSYSKDKKLIQDLNLNVEPGMRVAIVGPTGCGKTTIINLLMKFYDVDCGEICADHISYSDINVKSLRNAFGMVLQDTWLKTGTVYENIVMGKPDATLDEAVEAAKKSHAHSFIKRLPDGYNTFIGADGGNLSQGQKQLLCITRLMLVNPPMLILDEATSSIDTRTEIKIQKAFELLMKGKTTFIVAHRLSTIKNADLILVMNNGSVIEQGTHGELLKKKGFYYNLYNSQFAEFKHNENA